MRIAVFTYANMRRPAPWMRLLRMLNAELIVAILHTATTSSKTLRKADIFNCD